ncbi:hypothetical protein WBJ53_25165 [Spirosoma sp. SC4-14]|uniref:peptidoglycan-binding domain-containing protein n=1 Tax=Spirosoma sp. SC4-14 TaxID=3128900 RepID=UPI0030CB854A
MASTLVIQLTGLPTIYNVTYAVGLGQANRRTDVLLVQTLLKMAEVMTLSGGLPGGSTGHIKVDGYYGPQTQGYITAFQQTMALVEKKLISQDKIVSPSSKDGYTKSGWLYTIVHLNRAAKDRDSSAYKRIPFEPETPPELRTALMGPPEVFNP